SVCVPLARRRAWLASAHRRSGQLPPPKIAMRTRKRERIFGGNPFPLAARAHPQSPRSVAALSLCTPGAEAGLARLRSPTLGTAPAAENRDANAKARADFRRLRPV